MPGPIATAFTAEHRVLRELLRECLATPTGLDTACFDAFRLRLLQHIAVEERVLLPALEKKLGGPALNRNALRKDHAGIAALCVPAPNRDWVEELEKQLEEHHRVEESEGGFLALCDAHLSGQAPSILAAAERLPALDLAPFNEGRRMRDQLAEVMLATGLAS